MDDNKEEEDQPTAEETALQSASDHDLRSPYYCEENAWLLVYRHLNIAALSNGWHYDVVFISNHRRCCVMFQQKAAGHKDNVCWDYHVIVIRTRFDHTSNVLLKGSTQVLDTDTNLKPFPCPFEEYLDGSFPYATLNAIATNNSRVEYDKTILPMFRAVDASEFLKCFCSDRSHMFIDGEWSAPPPNYKPIMNGFGINDGRCSVEGVGNGGNNEKTSNLESYINMMSEESCSTGRKCCSRPLSLEEFRRRYS
jgi:hypothetical protein